MNLQKKQSSNKLLYYKKYYVKSYEKYKSKNYFKNGKANLYINNIDNIYMAMEVGNNKLFIFIISTFFLST